MGNFFLQNHYFDPLQSKKTYFSKKIAVRIDPKTFILVDPGITDEEARSQYPESLKTKMKE